VCTKNKKEAVANIDLGLMQLIIEMMIPREQKRKKLHPY
jgi:hypothetical protein